MTRTGIIRTAAAIAISIALALTVLPEGAAAGPPSAMAVAEEAPPRQLSADAERVVDYLLDDWKQQFRSTSVPLAMDNLGIAPNDALRLEILAHLRDHTDLHNNLTWWGPNNYVLSNQEKRIAKYLIHMAEREQRAAAVAEASEALGMTAAALGERLAFMKEAGFLQESADPFGFALAPGYKRWAGPLQHNFHTVRIEGEAPFDVW